MAKPSPENRFNATDSEGETTPGQPPLGLKKPILPPSTLGQNFLSPKFLSPLGAKPLGGSTSVAGFVQALPDASLPDNFFQDSSFFAESRLSLSNPEVAVTEATDVVGGFENPNPSTSLPPIKDKGNLTPQQNSLQRQQQQDLSIQLTDSTLQSSITEEVAFYSGEELQERSNIGESEAVLGNETTLPTREEDTVQSLLFAPEAGERVNPMINLSTGSEATSAPGMESDRAALLRTPLENPKGSADRMIKSAPNSDRTIIQPDLIENGQENSIIPLVPESASAAAPIENEQQAKENDNLPSYPQANQLSPSPSVESSPQESTFFSATPQPPQPLVQTKAETEQYSQLNHPSTELPNAIAPRLETDSVNLQPHPPETSAVQRSLTSQVETDSVNIPPHPPETSAVQRSLTSQDSLSVTASEEQADLTPQQSSLQEKGKLDSPQSSLQQEAATTRDTAQQKETVSSASPLSPTPSPSSTNLLQSQATELPESVSEEIVPAAEIVVQPLLETESSVQNQTVFPELDQDSSELKVLNPSSPNSQQSTELPQSSESIALSLDESVEAIANPIVPSPITPETSVVQRHPETISQDISSVTPVSETETLPQTIPPTEIVEATPEAIANPVIPTSITPETSVVQRHPAETLPQTIQPTEIVEATPEAIANPVIPTSITPETSVVQRHPAETLPQTIQPTEIVEATPEAIANPVIPTSITPETSVVQRHPAETLPQTIPPTEIVEATPEAIANPVIPTSITPETSVVQRHPAETLPQTIPPTEIVEATPEAIANPIVPTSITPETSVVQRHPAETLPQTIQPTEIVEATPEAIANPIVPTPTTPETSVVQRHPETISQDISSATPVSETETLSPEMVEATQENNVTEDESLDQNQEIPQLPTVLENLVGTRHAVSLIQPLNQKSQFFGTIATAESSKELPAIVQRKPEKLLISSSEETFNKTSNSIVQIPPLSLDTEPLTLRRFATDAISGVTATPSQENRQLEGFTHTSNVPDSWSNIAELLGEYTTDYSSAQQSMETPIQRALEDDFNGYVPLEGRKSNPWENLIDENPRYSNLSLISNPETSSQIRSTEQAVSHEEASPAEYHAQKENSGNEDSQSLEMLAWEIYGLIKQRLEIEKERYGNYYSGRLPW